MAAHFFKLLLLSLSLQRSVAAATNLIQANSQERHLQDNPTTCTDIPDGADAFEQAMHDAASVRIDDNDCLVLGNDGWHEYPHPNMEFSFVEMCLSNDSSTRYLFSNGIPAHAIHSPTNRPKHCTVPYAVSMPLDPTYDDSFLQENPVIGPLGFSLNGIPFVDAAWAVDNGSLFQDSIWSGHAASTLFYWHYHSSRMPPNGDYPAENELVGYAMDGFGIYGPVASNETDLDECNGRIGADGNYRYHMVRMEEIDFSQPQCNEMDPRVHNWNPIIGCYRGSTSQSRIWIDNGNRDGMTCTTLSLPPPDLATCLNDIGGDTFVILPDDVSYKNASSCHNSNRTDRTWSPRAVIKVANSEQVAEAVKCASLSKITVTPRSGAHGFENEACSGELIVDITNLQSLSVDTTTKIVEFGAGHVHGKLYRKLIDYGLVVPGGTENSVGTAGLWLGCGRGPLTQLYGLSCDNILGVEFVDARGNIRKADSNTDTDMFWMARGSGGEFPGVVTKFTVQAYNMPSEVFVVKNAFEYTQAKTLIKEWTARLDIFSDPSRKMFSHISSFNGTADLGMACFSCTEDEKQWMIALFDEIANSAGGGGAGTYVYWGGTWLDRLLKETWDDFEEDQDLLTNYPEWPEVWTTLANGAHMVPTMEASDQMLEIIQNALETHGEAFQLFMYTMTSPDIASVAPTDTAYGGREATYVIHYKFKGNNTNEAKLPLRQLSVQLDQAGLPCKSFYNYADREFPCAAESGDAWLEAHFSDVPRMKAIKEQEDPNDLFMSSLKAKKWREDINEYMYVGWPNVGDSGGTCTCPNGEVYQVGDNGDSCGSLACIGGIAGSCSENNPGGAGYQVVCATAPPTTSPTQFPTRAPATPEPSAVDSGTPAPTDVTESPTPVPTSNAMTPMPQSQPDEEPTIAPVEMTTSRSPTIPLIQTVEQLSTSASSKSTMAVSIAVTLLAMMAY
jgi:FAD/FMN-containing dehydrogenase